MQNPKYLLIDLDGTLTDAKEGITKSIQFALERMDHPTPSLTELTLQIGPPLRDYFAELLGIERAEAAMGHYRQRYDVDGMCVAENVVYPGMLDVLTGLKDQNKRLFVATAKPEIIAKRIVEHFGLSKFFQRVYGAELNERRSKKDELIAYIIDQEHLELDEVVMIGDRKQDIIGASKNSIRSVGVTWGYGSFEELETAGATAIVRHPEELLGLNGLLRLADSTLNREGDPASVFAALPHT